MIFQLQNPFVGQNPNPKCLAVVKHSLISPYRQQMEDFNTNLATLTKKYKRQTQQYLTLVLKEAGNSIVIASSILDKEIQKTPSPHTWLRNSKHKLMMFDEKFSIMTEEKYLAMKNQNKYLKKCYYKLHKIYQNILNQEEEMEVNLMELINDVQRLKKTYTEELHKIVKINNFNAGFKPNDII